MSSRPYRNIELLASQEEHMKPLKARRGLRYDRLFVLIGGAIMTIVFIYTIIDAMINGYHSALAPY